MPQKQRALPLFMIGRALGHYRIVEQIGEGGMGKVFRARDDRLQRDVAVKIITPAEHGEHDQDRLRRFEQEARAAAALNHPNILAIYDIGTEDGAPYIVSELLEGKTLRQLLYDGALPVRTATEYARQLAQALVAAHEKSIVHRDLKPENLFITKDGLVKVLDFGIAKLMQRHDRGDASAAEQETVTRVGMVMGTASYMSPEQLRARAVDHRTDIFSFGSILYEMLSGLRAFRGETNVDTITAVLKEEPKDLTEIQPNVPASFEPVVMHCLEKDPDNRFQSARDLIFALDTAAHSDTRKIAAVGRRQPLSRRWLISLAAAMALAVAVWFIARAVQAPPPAYTRLTFELGTIYTARFTPDGRDVMYDASWNGHAPKLYTSAASTPQEQSLSFDDAHLLALSPSNELALALHARNGSRFEVTDGTLARSPLAGGAPRELMEDVRGADWDARGEMAAIHYANGRYRLEYPLGNVIYEAAGWISHTRVNPLNGSLAFIDHPRLWDDRGSIAVIDGAKHRTTISPEYDSTVGLAWGPDGKEVWFTAVEKGYSRRLMAASLSGRVRNLLRVPGGLTLHDIAPDGRILLTMDDERYSMEASTRDGKNVQDLSWYNWTVPRDISSDGQWTLFEDSSEPAGDAYAACIRKFDGSPPIRLGDGTPASFSRDGKFVLLVLSKPSLHAELVPTGAGQSREIPLPGIEHVNGGYVSLLPDGRRVLVAGNQPGHQSRVFVQNLDGSGIAPVTPEGVVTKMASPDGKYIAAPSESGPIFLYPVEGGEPRSIPGLEKGFTPTQWSADSSAIYVYRARELPASVYRVEVMTGKRDLVREISPANTAGALWVTPIIIDHDANRFVYGYYQRFSTLYVISGLK